MSEFFIVLFSIIALVIVIVGALLALPNQRRMWVSKPLFNWFRKILPAMSDTEKAAIEAGNVGWEKSLFQGTPDWSALAQMPKPVLSNAEQHFLDNQVETFCALINDWEIVYERKGLSKEAWAFIKQEKLFGMIIPKEYGGLGFSVRAHSEIITKISTKSASAAVSIMVPNSLGPAELLLHYGTEEQKNKYLPKLATGEEIPCFALTSTEAGSDAGSMLDKGIVCRQMYNGQQTIGITLTFEKRYITLAPVATLVGVAFKLYDPDNILGDKKNRGITLALIPADLPGLEIGERHFPLNMGFMNGPIRAKDIFIPLDWVIGGEKMLGEGWRMLVECLAVGRGISLPALSTGAALLSCRMTSAYASIRKQFKMPIAHFQGIEEALARIIGNTYLLQATRLFTVFSIEQYVRPSIATAIAKYHMTELSRQVVNDAMDIHAGKGIMLGPKNYLANAYQAIPISITVEGANILTRNLMIFGQGAIRCHPFAKDEMSAASLYNDNPQKALEMFDGLLIKHIAYFIANLFRCLMLSLTRGYFAKVKVDNINPHYLKKLTWLSSGLAVTADLALMIMGGSLKRQERLSARLGDVLSQLYLASSAIKYFIDSNKPQADEAVLDWVLQTCCYQAQEAFYGFFDNAPHPLLRWVLKRYIFPFGKALTMPTDASSHRVVKTMLESDSFGQRLTQLCYIGKDDEGTGLMETTFRKLNKVKDLQQKLNEAIKRDGIYHENSFEQTVHAAIDKKILSQEEATALLEYEILRKKAISVDAFLKQ